MGGEDRGGGLTKRKWVVVVAVMKQKRIGKKVTGDRMVGDRVAGDEEEDGGGDDEAETDMDGGDREVWGRGDEEEGGSGGEADDDCGS